MNNICCNKQRFLLTIVSVIAFTFAVVFICTTSTVAKAENVADAQLTLDSAKAQLAEINSEYESAQAQANELEAELYNAEAGALQAQNKVLQEQANVNSIITYEYRNGSAMPFVDLILSSDSFESLIKNIDYSNKIVAKKQAAISEHRKAKQEFDNQLEELNSKYDSFMNAFNEANAKKQAAQDLVNKASANLSAAEAEQLKGGSTPPAPDPEPDPGTGDWSSGEASAYDSGTTATGAPITDSSMGVAVSMSRPNYRSLFGHTVQIKMGSTTVLATINDCGGFGGNRVLDLQPGVFHSFGYGSASAWGVRNIQYRIM